MSRRKRLCIMAAQNCVERPDEQPDQCRQPDAGTKPSLFVGKRLLVCGALEDDYPRQLATLTHSLTVFTTDYCYYRSQQATLGMPSCSTISSAAPPFRCPAAADAQGQGRGPVSAGHDDPLLEAGAELFLAGENRGASMAPTSCWPPMATNRSSATRRAAAPSITAS